MNSDNLRVVIEPLNSRATPKAVARAYTNSPDGAILESSRTDGPFARYSIFANDPIREVCIQNDADSFESFMNNLAQHLIHVGDVVEKIDSIPFVGGWIGYVSYDAATVGCNRAPTTGCDDAFAIGCHDQRKSNRTQSHRLDASFGARKNSRGSGDRGQPTAEAVGRWSDKNSPSPGRGDRSASFFPQHEAGAHSLPLAHFRLYDTMAIYDHHTDSWYGVFVDWPDSTFENQSSIQSRKNRLSQRFARIENAKFEPETNSCERASSLNNDWSRDDYLRAAKRALKYIADGDTYQINLAQRFSIETDLTPGDLYMRLRDCNPSSHAAFLTSRNAAIISSSPELFLNLCNGHVVTRPIKGTRPRGENEWSDLTNRDELESSEKDHAELAMIVDLMRNDLGRVCEFGTVRVSDPGTIETLPTVFHRTATIEGRLRENQNWSDLLLATFPGGSITGAPKIRAMQIINELEPAPRGVYCGSIGYIGLDGSMQMNIAIRTMTQIGRTVHIHAGSGIVADSEPEAEHAEILTKARAMFEAVGCEAPQPALCTGAAS